MTKKHIPSITHTISTYAGVEFSTSKPNREVWFAQCTCGWSKSFYMPGEKLHLAGPNHLKEIAFAAASSQEVQLVITSEDIFKDI